MQKIDEQGLLLCDIKDCKKQAVCNYQDAFIRWEINMYGDYSDKPLYITAGEETNIHLCHNHDTPDNRT